MRSRKPRNSRYGVVTAPSAAINLVGMHGVDAHRSKASGPIDLRLPQVQMLPVVLASPHSGTDYPRDFVRSSRLDPVALRRSEDSFVDEIFAAAPTLGAPLLAARFPRAYVDVNREPFELDPTMFADVLPEFVNARSPRVRMGLGTIARIVASGEEIYARKLSFADAKHRIETLYHPYHEALRRLLDDTVGVFGGYLLIDCHSMPSAASAACGQVPADIVLGDCHGTTCAPPIIEAAERYLQEHGFAVAINSPYAGGFTTGHYGQPLSGRHALQIEINRSLYMDERNYRRKSGLARLGRDMAGLTLCLAAAAQECLGITRLNAAE